MEVTHIKADAADSKAISSLVNRVLEEEGHLDFFFANAGVNVLRRAERLSKEKMIDELKSVVRPATDISEEEYSEIMRINALRSVLQFPSDGCPAEETAFSWRSNTPLRPWPRSVHLKERQSQADLSFSQQVWRVCEPTQVQCHIALPKQR